MRKPDFLIIGAAKSGTTSLSTYLSHHPEIRIVSNRLEHFGPYKNDSVENLSQQAYLHLFKGIADRYMAGEKSVSYLYSKKAAHEIKAVNSKMKIIMILRNPVQRAYSDFWHRRRTALENLSFEQALTAENKRIREGAPFELHYAHYGLYAQYVKTYFHLFGRKQCKVILFDDFIRRPETICKACFHFLGVRAMDLDIDYSIQNKGHIPRKNWIAKMLFRLSRKKAFLKVIHRWVPLSIKHGVTSWMNQAPDGGGYPPMKPQTQKELTQFFKPDILTLEKLINRDLHHWLEF